MIFVSSKSRHSLFYEICTGCCIRVRVVGYVCVLAGGGGHTQGPRPHLKELTEQNLKKRIKELIRSKLCHDSPDLTEQNLEII